MQLVYVILTILGSLAIFFILLGGIMRVRAFLRKGTDAPVMAGYAGSVLKNNARALLYFYSPTCGACGRMTPFIERLALMNDNILAVDVLADMDTAKKFKIMATPTLITVRNGKIHNILMGPQSDATVTAQLS